MTRALPFFLVTVSALAAPYEAPPRWREERTRPVPPPVIPANLNALTTAPVQPMTGAAKVSGTVVADGPVAGATVTLVTLVVAEPGFKTVSDQCLSSWTPRPCTCGSGARALRAGLDARRGEATPLARTKTDAKGGFTFGSVPPGKYGVWVDAAGLGSKFAKAVDGTPVEIALVPAMPLGGVVLDEAHDPVAGAIVTVEAAGGRYFDTVTGSDGKYAFNNLGGYSGVVARRDGYLPRWVHPERPNRIILQQPRTLRAQVLLDGQPAAGVPVELSATPCRDTAVSDARGEVTFEDVVPLFARVWKISARRDFLFASREVSVERHDEERVVAPLALLPSAELEIEVVDHLGQPASRGVMRLSRAGSLGGLVEPGLNVGLEPGTWTVSADGTPPSTVDVRLVAGQRTSARLKLLAPPKQFMLKGTVVDAQSRPTWAFVDARSIDGRASGVDGAETGRFSIALERGRYVVIASSEARASPPVTVDVPGGPVALKLAKTFAVTGTVVDPSGPVPDATLFLRCPKGSVFDAHTSADADGGFTLEARGQPPCDLEAIQYFDEMKSSRELHWPITRGTPPLALRFPPRATASGVVVDPAGAPYRRLEFTFVAANEQVHAVTTEDGAFSALLSTEPHTVSALHAPATPLAIVGGQTNLRLVLGGQRSIEGRVVGPDGGAVVDFEVAGRRIHSVDGTFVHPVSSTHPGSLDVFAPKLGSAQADVPTDGGALAPIVLGPPRVAKVVVKAEDGTPVAGTVVAESSSPRTGCSRWIAATRTGPDGTAWVDLRWPTSRVLVQTAARAWREVAAPTAELEVVLNRAPGRVRGVVKGKAGAIADARVCATDGTTFYEATTDRAGAFALTGVAAGSYTVTATAPNGASFGSAAFAISDRPVSVTVTTK